jgi:hypothetical protein
MTLKPIPDFQALTTHHCVTGSMRHIYVTNDHPISEDMLLGVGGGVGFVYWHMKGTMPFIGGRGKGRPGQGFEQCVGERTGVLIEDHTTASVKKAEASLLDLLAGENPVMIQCDMGYLPYFDFDGYEYHFGAHYIVVCGYDACSKMVLVADRDGELHPVSMEALAQARGSTHKPFIPKNRWFTFDFSRKRQPTSEEIRTAIREQTSEMLRPSISNLGVPGIRKAAQRIRQWPEVLDEEMLRFTLFNTYFFIDAQGGTGGGIFRYMFSRFMREAAAIIAEPRLNEQADQMEKIGDRWQTVAEIFKGGFETKDPNELLAEASRQMMAIADLEEAAWAEISTLVYAH